jgi:putative ABC transport system substrate-binding protein
MRRRDFIKGIVGSATAWPLAASAQQAERMRRIGVLIPLSASDRHAWARVAAFRERLQQLGWIEGSNVKIDLRWGEGDINSIRKHATELIALAPDVMLAHGTAAMSAIQSVTDKIPTVFVNVGDPVGGGLVASLARPGGNSTGFTVYDYGISAKWLELLKQIAPRTTRAALVRDIAVQTGVGQLGAVQSVAPALGVEVSALSVHKGDEIEDAVATFARQPNGGLIVIGSPFTDIHRELIISLAAKYQLPTIYAYRYYVVDGGLASYGPETIDPYRLAAGYIDRILKGEKLADLPVQAPTKYQLVINLKTAKALGLTVPQSLLTSADEVIE